MIKTTKSLSKSSKTLWQAIRALDFSFTSPYTLSTLKEASEKPFVVADHKEKTRKEKLELDATNTKLSASDAWVAVGSVRALSLPVKDSDKVPAEVRAMLFPQEVRLCSIDEEAHSLSFEIVAPSEVTLSAADAALVLPADVLANTADSVTVPLVGKFTIALSSGTDDSCEVELSSEVGEACTPLSRAFCTAYQEFLLSSLSNAVSGPYPFTPRRAVLDNYHGTTVADPFRWLEDPDSADTAAWVQAQNSTTKKVLDAAETRGKITSRLTEMYTYERFTMVRKAGDHYYYSKNDGLQNQYVVWQTDSLDNAGRVFLDPADLSKEGTAALGSTAFSESGKYYAYGVCRNGSDWNTIFIKDTKTHEVLADELHWVRFSSISWTHDDKGFFYCRYPAPAKLEGADVGKRGTETDVAGAQAVYYHRVGTKQEEDVRVFAEEEQPSWMFGVEVTDCGKNVLISVVDSCDPINRLWVFPLADLEAAIAAGTPFDAASSVVRLIDEFESGFTYIASDGNRAIIKTNRGAPRNKVVTLDLPAAINAAREAGNSGKGSTAAVQALLVDLIPEHPNGGVLDSVDAAGGRLVLDYTVDVCTQLEVRTLAGEKDTSIDLGFLPPFSTMGVRGKHDSNELSIFVTNFLSAGTSYVLNMDTNEHKVFRASVPVGFDADRFEVKQVFYPSVDNTRIPMFVIHKKGLTLDGSNPAYLYGYGGFNITLSPSFSVNRWLWMEHFNGVAAIANLRGGGEYGNEWHKAGCHDKKQNVFDDFASAARFLVGEGYTTHERIGIHGGSNGGLLVGASVNQQPKLFGAAVAAVGVLDMLRFHKFTIGYAWCSDYGCSEETKKDFDAQIAYSPLHTVPSADTALPAVMLTTADHDDRVVPLHSFKYISEVQRLHALSPANTLEKAPLVIRIETNAGHGAGMPLNKVIAEAADVYGFFAKFLRAKWTD